MAARDRVDPPREEPAGKERLMVEVGGGRRPFMRGIMVHSLMARGLSFEDAYLTAEEVRRRVRGRGVVQPAELAELIRELVGSENLVEPSQLAPPPAIQVSSGGRSLPFSKGTLSQSVLAAALQPTDAFDVAREIETELLRRETEKISRSDLRRLAYETLLHRFGKRTAELYLVWRYYQEPSRPIVVLLGGTTGAGKTSLALEVARRLGIRRVLSTDTIRQIMRIMLSPELMPAIHASSFDAHRELPMLPGAEDLEIEGFRAQAQAVSVGVRAMLDRAVAENTSLVLDGVNLVPGLIDLEAYKDVAHVIYLVISTLDEQAFAERFEERGGRQERRGTHRYVDNLGNILKIQDYFLELADRYDVPIVDNASIDASVIVIIRHIVESLRKKGEFDPTQLL